MLSGGPVILAILGIAMVILLAALVSSSWKRSFTDFPDEIRTAAFRWIDMPNPTPSYLGGGLEQIAAMKELAAERRREAENLKPGDFKDCVLAWLDYYENQSIPRDAKELQEQTSKRRLDDYRARQEVKRQRVDEILRAHPHSGREDR